MKIKLATLVNSQPALMTLLQEKTKREIAFSLAHNVRIIREALQPYEEFRKNTIIKYGKQQEDGNFSIEPNSKEIGKYGEEINKYIGENELELDLKKIKLDLLPNEILGAILLDLDWMIETTEVAPRKKHK